MAEREERLAAELDLLDAMYPSAVSFSPRGREVTYKYVPEQQPASTSTSAHSTTCTLLLRLPDLYPSETGDGGGLPDVLQATGPRGEDIRSRTRDAIARLNLPPGEEALDAIVLAFRELVLSLLGHSGSRLEPSSEDAHAQKRVELHRGDGKTVIIWLHHLLNANKRKLALNPSLSGGPSVSVAGMTKPGYPGVLVFSGPKAAVDAHVAELRAQRWQAFQVRYDSEQDGMGTVSGDDVGSGDGGGGSSGDGAWAFEHGTGIREVESMSELARGIPDARRREVFLGVIGVK